MGKALKYQVYCETDSKYEYVWTHEDDATPTKCPTDTSHTVTSSSISVVDAIEELVNKTQVKIGTDDIKLYEFGYNFTATKDSETDHDKLLPVKYMRGCWFEAEDHEFGDQITVQIVDVDNVLGAGAGYVADEFGKTVQVPSSGIFEVMSEVRTGEIPSGLYIRVKYDSQGTVNDVKCKMNCLGYNDA